KGRGAVRWRRVIPEHPEAFTDVDRTLPEVWVLDADIGQGLIHVPLETRWRTVHVRFDTFQEGIRVDPRRCGGDGEGVQGPAGGPDRIVWICQPEAAQLIPVGMLLDRIVDQPVSDLGCACLT